MDTKQTIIKTAVKLAEELNSPAIFVSGNIQPDDIDVERPVYFTSMGSKNIIDHLLSTGDFSVDISKRIASKITTEAAIGIEHIENSVAIEHMIGQLEKGTIVGIIETNGSSAIITHDLTQNSLIETMKECEERVSTSVIRAVLSIAFDIAASGREGKKIGTAFIIGDVDEVMMRSHQMVLNPYEGHPEEDRDILDNQNWESIKEFAQIDGVFIISEEGMIHAAGRYLDIDARDIEIDKGLGGRHVSAAAITRDTVSIAITISESGGTIRLYMDGKDRIHIEAAGRPVKKEQ